MSNDHSVELGGPRIHSDGRWCRFCPRLLLLTPRREAREQAGSDEATGEDQGTGHGDRHVQNEVSEVGQLNHKRTTDEESIGS